MSTDPRAAGERPTTRGSAASPPRSAAIVVATAAVTIALGVTAAALGGYIGPRRGPPSGHAIDEGAAAPKAAAEGLVGTDAPLAPGAGAVVLVPVTREQGEPSRAPTEPELTSEPVFAAYERTSHSKHEREHDGDGDGDDRREAKHKRRKHASRSHHHDD